MGTEYTDLKYVIGPNNFKDLAVDDYEAKYIDGQYIVTYFFPQSTADLLSSGYRGDEPIYNHFIGTSSEQQNIIISILEGSGFFGASFQDVSNINFVQSSEGSNIGIFVNDLGSEIFIDP